MINITLPDFKKISFVLTGNPHIAEDLKRLFEQGRALGYREGQANWWAVQDKDEIWQDAMGDGTDHTNSGD